MKKLLSGLRSVVRPGRIQLAGAITVVGVLAVVLPGLALSPSKFEIDHTGAGALSPNAANMVVNTSGNTDWCADFPAPVSPNKCVTTAPGFVAQDDIANRNTDDSFGQGTDEDTQVPTVVTGSIPPKKDDLSRYYVAHEIIGSTAFLYLGWQRTNSGGTATEDFEFNKSSTLSANGVTPVRTAGDRLIAFDFSGGGATVDLKLLTWITTGAGSQCKASSGPPCWGNETDLSATGEADGAVNDGNSVYDPIGGEAGAAGNIPDKQFGEAVINLTSALDLGPNDCTGFASAYLKSRSSTSFNSAMKDFIAPKNVNLNLCQPATIKVKKVDARDHTTPLAGGVFQLYRNDGTDATQLDAGDHLLSNCTTDSTGGCTFVPDVSGAGTVSFLVHEQTAPGGYTPGADQIFNVTFSTSTQTIERTFEDTPAFGTINIHKQDDSSPANPLAGARFTLFTDNGTTTGTLGPPDGAGPNQDSHGAEDTEQTSLSCTTNTSGDCQIASVPLAKYWVVETTTPGGYSTAPDQYANVGVGSQPGQGQTISLTFTNPRLHKIIVIVCHQGTNTLVGSSVDLNGGTPLTSLSSAPTGLTQAQLCGLDGARFGGLGHGGGKTLNVTIPGSGTGSGH
jgi:hypothetical protein